MKRAQNHMLPVIGLAVLAWTGSAQTMPVDPVYTTTFQDATTYQNEFTHWDENGDLPFDGAASDLENDLDHATGYEEEVVNDGKVKSDFPRSGTRATRRSTAASSPVATTASWSSRSTTRRSASRRRTC